MTELIKTSSDRQHICLIVRRRNNRRVELTMEHGATITVSAELNRKQFDDFVDTVRCIMEWDW